jgi:hypothetical protein
MVAVAGRSASGKTRRSESGVVPSTQTSAAPSCKDGFWITYPLVYPAILPGATECLISTMELPGEQFLELPAWQTSKTVE